MTLWIDAGCLEAGYKSPNKLPEDEMDILHVKNLMQVKELLHDYKCHFSYTTVI